MSNTTDATCGTGTGYPSAEPRYTLVFVLLSALYYKCGLLSMAMFYRRRSYLSYVHQYHFYNNLLYKFVLACFTVSYYVGVFAYTTMGSGIGSVVAGLIYDAERRRYSGKIVHASHYFCYFPYNFK